MAKEKMKLIMAELKNAELQEDGIVEVTVIYDKDHKGIKYYANFRDFCDELIQKIMRIQDVLGG